MYNYKQNFKGEKKVRIDDSDNNPKKSEYILNEVKDIHGVKQREHEEPRSRDELKYKKEKKYHRREYSPQVYRSYDEIDRKYEQKRSRRSRNRSYFNPILGDNLAYYNPTRTYVYYRQPFDWYDDDQADVLEEYEEVILPEKQRYYSRGNVYDAYDRFDGSPDRELYRSSSRRRRYSFDESENEEPRQRGIMKKGDLSKRDEHDRESNLFAFSQKNRREFDRNDDLRDLSEISENFSELSVERNMYKNGPIKY